MSMTDEVLERTAEWLYGTDDDADQRERIDLWQGTPGQPYSDGIQVTLEYAVLKAGKERGPASLRVEAPSRSAIALLEYAVEEPAGGIRAQRGMRVRLEFSDGESDTVQVPLHIDGSSPETAVIRYDPDLELPGEQDLADLIYVALRHGLDEDSCPDNASVRTQRAKLEADCVQLSRAVRGETHQAFIAMLHSYVSRFETAVPWPTEPAGFDCHQGRIRVTVLPG